MRPFALVFAVAALVAGTACTEPVHTRPQAVTTTRPGTDCSEAVSITVCAPRGTMLDRLWLRRPTKASATAVPIRIGTINQDTGVAGAFPELTAGYRTAIDFVNAELGGVDGRPIELVACDTAFSADRSLSCAQTMVDQHVVAVVGGIDVWGNGIKVLEQNGIPFVGGVPVSFLAARSPVSFQFSGGLWGAMLGELKYSVRTLHAKRIVVVTANFDPIMDAARLAQRSAARLGAELRIVTVPAIGADMASALADAATSKPDVVIALTSDSGCVPAMTGAQQVGMTAPLMLTGACAAPKVLERAGSAGEGRIFNLEADLDPKAPDGLLYFAITERYGPRNHLVAASAATVSFRAMMNLYVQMRRIGGAHLTPARLLTAFRAARDERSFMGHPYTCDGSQFPGYPAMCAPQQTLGRNDHGTITQLGGWIDIADLAR